MAMPAVLAIPAAAFLVKPTAWLAHASAMQCSTYRQLLVAVQGRNRRAQRRSERRGRQQGGGHLWEAWWRRWRRHQGAAHWRNERRNERCRGRTARDRRQQLRKRKRQRRLALRRGCGGVGALQGRHLGLPANLQSSSRAHVAMKTVGSVSAALALPEPAARLAATEGMQGGPHGRQFAILDSCYQPIFSKLQAWWWSYRRQFQ